MDTEPGFEGQLKYSYKSFWDHLLAFVSPPWPIFAIAIAVFGVLWTFGEAAIQFTDAVPRGLISFIVLICLSLTISVVWNIYLYINKIPNGFENTSRSAQRIAHLQREKWEFKLARTLLEEKIEPLHKELDDLISGKRFIPGLKSESFLSYYHWISSRTRNLENMISISKRLLLNEFPQSIQSTNDRPADPQTILLSVNTLARFYRDIVEFECSARMVMPSEQLSTLHNMQFGWTEPIRKAVIQIFDFLDCIIAHDSKKEGRMNFEFEFEEVPNYQEFLDELARLENVQVGSEFWW